VALVGNRDESSIEDSGATTRVRIASEPNFVGACPDRCGSDAASDVALWALRQAVSSVRVPEQADGAPLKPYYQDEAVTLYHADCLDVLPTLEPVDHVITDPPYALIVVNTSKGAPRGFIGKADRRELGYEGVDHLMRFRVGYEIGRLTRRWALVFCDAESLSAWRVALEDGGLRHIRMGAWVSPACTPQFSGDRPGTGWEACEIAHAQGRSKWNGGGSPAAWVVNRPLNGSEERAASGHPTPKPGALLDIIVQQYTDANDLILDPFGGSGTTAVAAKRLGRRCILIEREEKYCEVAAKRLHQSALGLWTPEPQPQTDDLLKQEPEAGYGHEV
jgi:hypothetical protein